MSPIFLRQVSAVPKKRPDRNQEQSQKIEPETWAEKAAACLTVVLKDSADARTASIKLSGLDYASELAKKLLQHAEEVETFYTRLKKAVTEGTGEKGCKAIMEEYEKLSDFGAKAQAWFEIALYQYDTTQHVGAWFLGPSD